MNAGFPNHQRFHPKESQLCDLQVALREANGGGWFQPQDVYILRSSLKIKDCIKVRGCISLYINIYEFGSYMIVLYVFLAIHFFDMLVGRDDNLRNVT